MTIVEFVSIWQLYALRASCVQFLRLGGSTFLMSDISGHAFLLKFSSVAHYVALPSWKFFGKSSLKLKQNLRLITEFKKQQDRKAKNSFTSESNVHNYLPISCTAGVSIPHPAPGGTITEHGPTLSL